MMVQLDQFSEVWVVLQWAFTLISTVVSSVAMFILKDLMNSRHTHAQRITEAATNVEWLTRILESYQKETIRRLDDIQRRLDAGNREANHHTRS